MHAFNYHRPTTIEEAKRMLAALPEGKYLGGGQSLVPVLKLELAAPSDLVSLSGLSELSGIRATADRLTIGANSTHAEVNESDVVRRTIPSLSELAHGIGDAQVRNRGTLGGAVAHADPQADYPAAILALDARVETDRRTIAADDFFTGLFETALEPNEIVKAVHFARPEKAAYAKFPNPASKYAIVGVMVAQFGDRVRVGVTGAAHRAFRHEAMETALTAHFTPEAVHGIPVDADDFLDELDASPAYRAHLLTVMAKRAVRDAH
jgi:carbon-monoxide dehydrogenase medium subunit